MLFIVLFVSIVLVLFQYKPVQTWAAKKGAAYLSKELHTKVDIKSLYIKPFSTIVLEDLYVLDKQHDTLLRTPKLEVELRRFSIFNSIKRRSINFQLIQLDNGSVYLKKYKDSTSNLKFILDYFQGRPDTSKKAPGRPWHINFEKIAVNNLHFRYKNYLEKDTLLKKQVNFNDIDVNRLSVQLQGLDVSNHLFKAGVQNFTLHEKSGLFIKTLSTNITVDTNQILAQNLLLVTPKSYLKNYFKMRFKDFGDVSEHIEDRVYMEADLHGSKISSEDVRYFTSSLEGIRFDFGLNGRAWGTVNDLKAKQLTITGGQATYLKGDFRLKGLPDWDHTYFDLRFNQLASNKRDLDHILGRLANSPKFSLPVFMNKFGNINFSGRLTGYQTNFLTQGTFKTKPGRVETNLRIKQPGEANMTYAGKVKGYNFDLGGLLDQAALGRSTFDADINGKGINVNTLSLKANARMTYLTYSGYSYQNLKLDGSFIRQVANAKININDRNIKLALNGRVNLNEALPTYKVGATLQDARLYRLHLLKDTITLSAKLNTSFRGNNLRNLQGSIVLSPLRIVDPRNNFVVDSVALTATGLGNNRVISLRSDIADGSIKGTYDLATLPAYFKSVVKKYIPSLKTTFGKPGRQNFDFTLRLKNLSPALIMFAPQVSIPDSGTFNGHFNSINQTATLNGLIKTIKYGKIVLHDFIIDESTDDNLLGVNVSLSRVDLTDSLFIKNINITNFLQRDSLKFNVKLSDKNAVNQLDLYGLVEFGRDTTAKLKLLPSDVVLENQNWKLQQQVRIRLLNGKTQVTGFELSNGEQRVRINGFISDNPEDELKVVFDKFSMTTLDQLTKAAGVKFTGRVNGEVKLTSVIKSPGVDADLRVDTLTMNDTYLGNLKIQSSLDEERKQAKIKLNLLDRGLETVDISGLYLLGTDNENALDFDVRMNQTKAVIFSPFTKGLVSNLKGNISTDLKLTGPVASPKLNGTVTLAGTGLTVDYLKVPYTIDDKLQVTNSVIKVDNLKMRDVKGGIGTANGTVDLTNISTPKLDVNIEARNLMALNTTFKDNHIYYGRAFASGRFSFTGPIDSMYIDIKARSEDSTVFNIPLNTSATAGEYDFVRFVSHKDTTNIISNGNAFKGITLNFDLSIDEKTLVRITTDLGVLEGRGISNNLNLKINSFGDFDMYGDYQISSGKFEFTAKNFISKNFAVSQGGTIRWTGNPSNAEINLRAIYEVRTNINNLYVAAGLQSPTGDQYRLVQAELIITRSLLQPQIDFDFNFPTDPSVKDNLSTYLNDYNNRSQQALSIIVRRQFAPGTGSNINSELRGTASEAVSEFAFNKLNSLIAQSNIKYFDLNIRSLNDASASVKVLNDRLIFSGSLYSTYGSNNLFVGSNTQNSTLLNSDNLTKDFAAEFLIRTDGRLRGRYSYRVLNSTTLGNLTGSLVQQYVNGVGLIYQRDFDTFGDFFREMFGNRRRIRRNAINRADTAGSAPPPPTNAGGNNDDER
ncbi:translocation/assembly module TamB domain-containing protein [Mucilaginibacter sp.]